MNENTRNDHSKVEAHVIELLNGGIDGELTSAEQTELQELLDGSAQVRALKEELESLTDILDSAPEREPPGYLQDAITSQVRLPVVNDQAGNNNGFFSNLISAPWARTSLAVAAGLVLTVSIYQTDTNNLSPEDASNMTGTILKSPGGVLLDSTEFNFETSNGIAELRLKDGLLLVDVNLESTDQFIVNLAYSDQDLEYAGINGLGSEAGSVVVENGVISVTSSGLQHFELSLRSTTELAGGEYTPLVVEFIADNVLVHVAELDRSK